MKILLVTVGGSPKPILTTIETLQPDRVIFLCSAGSKGSESQVIGTGTPCEIRQGAEIVERLPNIPTQAKLTQFDPDRDLIRIQNPDDLSECYNAAVSTIRNLQQQEPNGHLTADYTGGTKTMSVALAMAALDYGVTLYLTTNTTRENLLRVERGEATERARTALIAVDRTIEQVLPRFLQQYNYPAAIAELNALLRSMELPTESSRRIRELRDCCLGLDAWDRFDHLEAWRSLQPYMKSSEIRLLGLFLKRVISSRAVIDSNFSSADGMNGHGYEIVEDLLLNAERRAAQDRYDDAVGRLYRALELLAQIHLLQTYDIKTGNVDMQKLPEFLHEKYTDPAVRSRDGKVQLALTRSYVLLSELPDDSLGQLYLEYADRIQNALQIRNYSLFAHGFTPITKVAYQNLNEVFFDFIQSGIAAIAASAQLTTASQFPKQLSL
ncbi:TIGR02710 family CRISPR-associated protein [Kovacikia minuta CCNUW1]|uniref:TIGR02710 family CRISPR-associated CARF protein n=1 Tax=Kovacikia minuta TaxID=2931930 RepID=UPI001CCA033B|nr:TIGR02710 family CRISPR-associated CARF protein [Kovacikia minuta]UBF24355.1 TIGR02710 family CRISPR-associated protein [Kovacikia minuta CCNUW1]